MIPDNFMLLISIAGIANLGVLIYFFIIIKENKKEKQKLGELKC